MNELKLEKSPYLLQHKDNPVHWKPWGDKAFRSAQDQGKLIFLSIGYATCHWCHVMEHESFEAQDVAEVLNTHFVAIKVDREELPDVDQIYMDALQAMGQRGGWPLNLFLTPDLLPIYGGTYYPKPDFLHILRQIHEIWQAEPGKMRESGEQLLTFLNQQARMYVPAQASASAALGSEAYEVFEQALQEFSQSLSHSFDPDWGGFTPAPKFPPHQQLRLMFCLARREPGWPTSRAMLEMAELTLKKMAQGGIYDHVGGGLTRYSVDERWEIPHFEKMLYVNAQAIHNYLDLYQSTQDGDALQVVQDIISYVERDMTSTGGGFFSAEDADSEGEEGKFYAWSYPELQQNLTAQELSFLEMHFGVSEVGNFEGKNNLVIRNARFWEPRQNLLWTQVRNKLFAIREQRIRPLLDDKQLTSWNGLMISALARAGRVLGQDRPIELASRAAASLKRNLWQNGRLFRRYRDGHVGFDATLDDYAFLIEGLLELYQASADEGHLLWAIELQELQENLLGDPLGGYYFTSEAEKNLIVRVKTFGDNALPNSNGVSLLNLVKLSHLTLQSKYREQAVQGLRCLEPLVSKAPLAFAQALQAYVWLTSDVQQFVCAELPTAAEWKTLETELSDLRVIAFSSSKVPSGFLSAGKDPQAGKYFLCQHGVCQAPAKNLGQILQQLKDSHPQT